MGITQSLQSYFLDTGYFGAAIQIATPTFGGEYCLTFESLPVNRKGDNGFTWTIVNSADGERYLWCQVGSELLFQDDPGEYPDQRIDAPDMTLGHLVA